MRIAYYIPHLSSLQPLAFKCGLIINELIINLINYFLMSYVKIQIFLPLVVLTNFSFISALFWEGHQSLTSTSFIISCGIPWLFCFTVFHCRLTSALRNIFLIFHNQNKVSQLLLRVPTLLSIKKTNHLTIFNIFIAFLLFSRSIFRY